MPRRKREPDAPGDPPGAAWYERAYSGATSEEYKRYMRDEWGHEKRGDDALFEKLSLEGAQAGLSWATILAKRAGYRAAFHGFDFARVAGFEEGDVERLLQDAGIVRHRGKIEAVINNARRALDLIDEKGSLASYVWSFEPRGEAVPHLASTSPASTARQRRRRSGGPRRTGSRTGSARTPCAGTATAMPCSGIGS